MATNYQAILISVLIASLLAAGCTTPRHAPDVSCTTDADCVIRAGCCGHSVCVNQDAVVPAPTEEVCGKFCPAVAVAMPSGCACTNSTCQATYGNPTRTRHPSTANNSTTPVNTTSVANASSVAEANNLLGFDLYAKLKEKEGNLVFSPWSVTSALAMTQEGAKGQTHDEMARTLYLTQPAADIRASFEQIDARLNAPDKGYQLSSANALWVQKEYPILSSYRQVVEGPYSGGISNVDFIKNTEGSRQTINTWVEQRTHDRIKDLISPGALTDLTRLVLTNAVYFKAAWQKPFENYSTTDQDFFSPGRTVTAKLMHQVHTFGYGETPDLQILELPYNGSEVSMVVILPKTKDGLPQLEQQLTAENLAAWQEAMKAQKVEVYLPRFKFTFGMTSLAEPLQSLGMTLPFDPNAADFSGMSSDPQGLYISDVLHKAFIETNEEGTEAAAATAVIMMGTTAFGQAQPPPVFRVDHPFLFLIRDNVSGAILFMGRVNDPTA